MAMWQTGIRPHVASNIYPSSFNIASLCILFELLLNFDKDKKDLMGGNGGKYSFYISNAYQTQAFSLIISIYQPGTFA